MNDHYEDIGPCLDHGKTRNVHERGYACCNHEGNRKAFMHRVAYINAHGLTMADIAGLVVRHRCDNTRCINSDHLIIGTHADNKNDAVERGRAAKGSAHGISKLTEADVIFCRENYVPQSRTLGQTALARRFGVSQFAMSQAIRGLLWKHVPGVAKNV